MLTLDICMRNLGSDSIYQHLPRLRHTIPSFAYGVRYGVGLSPGVVCLGLTFVLKKDIDDIENA